ncbi:hypothetical protein [Hydrogenophaga sp. T2]|uniref:hypothetical protein n=1 Tax=Hydrogenophaga sp. T2 TaxID=3132823 RepID=UPI003CEFE541
MKTYTRDETVHGFLYVRADEARAEIEVLKSHAAYLGRCVESSDQQYLKAKAENEAHLAAMRQALEALEDLTDTGFTGGPQGKRAHAAIAALKARLGDD